MGVPKHIRSVPRPTNTVVIDNGKDGPTRYAVRERNGVQYVPGGNPQPKNGKVIGHIVDGVYVPIGESSTKAEPDMLSYGACAFVRSVSKDLFSELLSVYTPKDTYTIMAIAALFSFLTLTGWGKKLEQKVYYTDFSDRQHIWVWIVAALAFIFCVAALNATSFSPFIYFRF